MGERKRLLLLITIMISVSMLVAGYSLVILYNKSFEHQRQKLQETAKSHARHLAAMYRYELDRQPSEEEVRAILLSYSADTHNHYREFSETGEFTLAERHGDKMVFLIRLRHHEVNGSPERHVVPWAGNLAAPMRRALNNEAGIMSGPDYRGVKVLAAYESVPELQWGIVAKIDLAEIRAPLIRSGLICLAISLSLVLLGSWLFSRTFNPLIRQLEESEQRFRRFMDNNPTLAFIKDATGRLIYANQAFLELFNLKRDDLKGKNIFDLLPLEIVRICRNSDQDVLLGNKNISFQESLVLQGRTVSFLIFKFPMVDGQGNLNVAGIAVDITKQQEAEKALRESEHRYHTLARMSPVGIFRADVNGDCVYVNTYWSRLAGLSLEEAQGQGWAEGLHPEDRQRIFQEWTKTVTQKQPFKSEYRFQQQDGTMVWVFGQAVVEKEADGEICGFVGTITNITERKLMEERLLKMNRALSMLYEGSRITVACHTEKDLLHDICRIIVEAGGYRLAWVGFALYDEKKTVEPVAFFGEGEDYVKGLDISWADTIRGRGPTGTVIRTGKSTVCRNINSDIAFAPWRQEAMQQNFVSSIALPLKNGNRRFGALNIYSSSADAFGKEEIKLLEMLAADLSYGISALRARSERQQASLALAQSDARLRAIMENVADAIITMNENSTIESFNRAAEDIFGYRADEVVGRDIAILMPEPHRSRHSGYVHRFLSTGQSRLIGVGSREVEGQRRDGSLVPIDLSISEMRLAEQRLFVGVVRDITERRKANAELHQAEIARITAEKANLAKNEFLASMSHELRTPLTGVLGLAQTILRASNKNQLSDEMLEKYLGNVIDSAKHLASIIDDLLYVSRIEAGRVKMHYEPVDFQQIVDNLDSSLLAYKNGKQLVFEKDIPVEFPPLMADPKRLTQIMINLVGNSIKFTDQGFVRIAAESRAPEDDSLALIKVSDSGCGISPENLPHIFDRFMRAENSGSIPGTGLGLTITKRLLEIMGGRIWVESELGRGTTFFFTLRHWRDRRRSGRG